MLFENIKKLKPKHFKNYFFQPWQVPCLYCFIFVQTYDDDDDDEDDDDDGDVDGNNNNNNKI